MKLTYKQGDLFNADNKYILAHCVAADLALGAGIALQFRKRFGPGYITELWQKNTKLYPQVIYTETGRPTYNLVTKMSSYHKPTFDNLYIALTQLKNSMIQRNQKYLAIPKIGAGLDRLPWEQTEKALLELFAETDIEIEVYCI